MGTGCSQDGVDLKAELGLAEDGYKGAQEMFSSVGSQLEDLLEKISFNVLVKRS